YGDPFPEMVDYLEAQKGEGRMGGAWGDDNAARLQVLQLVDALRVSEDPDLGVSGQVVVDVEGKGVVVVDERYHARPPAFMRTRSLFITSSCSLSGTLS